ncbi:hypothetical protein FGADI_9100 [Fusarium gaditjirri]|uniref:Uncharacterized protein n=1 Tax=Fusarium gaditjirri TaxID=282569 RepID=A0A8H4T0K3_9HYPO|nr:hypothetical protein FGADI_9100 [Fusarium gaditjirri]
MPRLTTPHPRHIHWTCPHCPTENRNVNVNATRCPNCHYQLASFRPSNRELIEALDTDGWTIGELVDYVNGVATWDYPDALVTTGSTMNDTIGDEETRNRGRTNGGTTNGETTDGRTTYGDTTDEDATDEDTTHVGRANGRRPNGVTTIERTTIGRTTNGVTTNGATTHGDTTDEDATDEDTTYAGRTNGGRPNGTPRMERLRMEREPPGRGLME